MSDTSETSPPRKKLGRGLGALMGEMRRDEPVIRLNPQMILEDAGLADRSPRNVNRLHTLPISAIAPHPTQPRTYFDEDALAELAESIRARGVIQPIIVLSLIHI